MARLLLQNCNGDGFPDLYVLNMQGDDHYTKTRRESIFGEDRCVFSKDSMGGHGHKVLRLQPGWPHGFVITDMHSDMTKPANQATKANTGSNFERGKSETFCAAEWSDAFLQGASNNIFGNAFY